MGNSMEISVNKQNKYLFSVPLPPSNMSIERVSSNSVLVHWRGPEPGSSVVSEFAIRYQTESDAQWVRLPPVQASSTEAEVTDMTPGERYSIQVNTVSAGVESTSPQQVNHTVREYTILNHLKYLYVSVMKSNI